MNLRTLLTILFLLAFAALSGGVRPNFETEQLVFTLSDSLLVFEGVFGFSNLSNEEIRQSIFFPIPFNDTQMIHEKASVTWENSGEALMTKSIDPGLWFGLDLPARSMKLVRISYQQKLKARRAQYVLLTALDWPTPLAYASYEVILPPGSTITRHPFAIGDMKVTEQGSCFWEYYDFRPQEDFLIEWE
ncbi:MAG: hypothetical protein PHU99_07265 [Candidatus Cloacimonetes bacterium]|nr:hypothetical protein [Candidatus Cloacimonadota bacterium]MCK9336045.1 hypothetical protein [Candidatus Cloacimonadota bacterium]MDD2684079.1 hypothetical protein [Candidatus Cloacimonadota bacterium]MDD3097498.1 hypothetical protein [Candidatus Cloacimonadota bacterium]MDD4667650.1 hypothetical protein [Candidatus Cloacimonadota bacterium]